MNKLKLFFKRLFCKHENIEVTKLSGDAKTFYGYEYIKCKDCGKSWYR